MSADQLYSYDEDKIAMIKSKHEWMNNPKYFQRVKISPSAIVKMMTHSQSGVNKGIKQNGKPIEVMGLLFGHPDVNDLQCLVVTDAQPIPAEGFETKVVIDDDSVINYMINLSAVNEETRKFSYCGWYHTHPFDVDENSHCYLSSTDINTQRQWQRAEDPHGNPWLAIVIDPLRSVAQGRPELKAFRAYPVEYEPPQKEAPDGAPVTNEMKAVEKWGVCWKGYYELEISYFMSSLAMNALNVLKNKFMWMTTFTSTNPRDSEQQAQLTSRINEAAIKIGSHSGMVGASFRPSVSALATDSSSAEDKESKIQKGTSDIAAELGQESFVQIAKNALFGNGAYTVSGDETNEMK